jgi:hypothetical protein
LSDSHPQYYEVANNGSLFQCRESNRNEVDRFISVRLVQVAD